MEVKPGLSSPALCGLSLHVCAVGVTVGPASQGCCRRPGQDVHLQPRALWAQHCTLSSEARAAVPSAEAAVPPHLPGSVRSYWGRLEQGNEGVSSLQATGAGPCPIWTRAPKPEPGESRPCLRRGDVPGDSGCELRGSQQEFVPCGSGGCKSQIKVSAGPGILPASSSFRRLLAILGLRLHPPISAPLCTTRLVFHSCLSLCISMRLSREDVRH